jgi:hypothetical protein
MYLSFQSMMFRRDSFFKKNMAYICIFDKFIGSFFKFTFAFSMP